jgi:type VI secretion system protein ImpK
MPENPAASIPGQTRRPDNLALAFQEILTVIERLRSNRQPIPDAATFRQQFRAALQQADSEARRRGYTAEDIQLAIFAVVAFLDESILNLRSPIFADWPRQPLQEEFFGHHIAGEVFFQHLQRLLGANETHTTADVLEVFYLCMLLGFAGRYSIGGRGDLRSLMDQTAEKIRRIRRTPPDLSPRWRIPPDTVQVASGDPLVKRFLIGAVASLALAVVLFTTYKIVLASGVSTLRTAAVEGRR